MKINYSHQIQAGPYRLLAKNDNETTIINTHNHHMSKHEAIIMMLDKDDDVVSVPIPMTDFMEFPIPALVEIISSKSWDRVKKLRSFI